MKNVLMIIAFSLIVIGAVFASLQITSMIHDKFHEDIQNDTWVEKVYEMIADPNKNGRWFSTSSGGTLLCYSDDEPNSIIRSHKELYISTKK